jgi:hypothetical protein
MVLTVKTCEELDVWTLWTTMRPCDLWVYLGLLWHCCIEWLSPKNQHPQAWLRFKYSAYGGVTIAWRTITRTRYQQLANGHLNCLFNRRGQIGRRLARSTGKKHILDDLCDEPVLCFHRNLCAAKRYLSVNTFGRTVGTNPSFTFFAS